MCGSGKLERLAAYLIRSSFSQERMEYLPDQARVQYRSKDGKEHKSYDALEWLAAMGTHVPGRGQQSVRYYGFLSNASRGKRRKQQQEGEEPLPPSWSRRRRPRGWARTRPGPASSRGCMKWTLWSAPHVAAA